MRRIIGAVVLFGFLYVIQRSYVFPALSGLVDLCVTLSFLYLAVSIIRYLIPFLRKPATTGVPTQHLTPPAAGSPKKSSSNSWFVAIIAVALLIYFFREMLGRYSYGVLLYLDNLVMLSQSVPPFISWALLGLFVGAVYGSFVAWKKYKLHFTINLIPLAVFAVAIVLLIIINDPSGHGAMAASPPGIDSTEFYSPKNLIVKRWELADVTGKNRKNFLRQKKNKKSELEFMANGKCYMYENGVTTQFVYYTLSSDGRFMEFTDSGREEKPVQFEIVSISAEELKLKSPMFGNGTATLKAK